MKKFRLFADIEFEAENVSQAARTIRDHFEFIALNFDAEREVKDPEPWFTGVMRLDPSGDEP